MAKATKSSPEPEQQSLTDAFRQRMTEEQELRGYTDAGLAHRASQFHPVAANTIWQIKKRGRRVDIDEADAIARALSYPDVRALVESAPGYQDFRACFLPLMRELGQLSHPSVDDDHPLNVIRQLGPQFTQERTPTEWRAMLAVPAAKDSLGNPQVMVSEMQGFVEDARRNVDAVLAEFAADLDRTAQCLQDAEEGGNQ